MKKEDVFKAMETLKKMRELNKEFCMEMFRLNTEEVGTNGFTNILKSLDNAEDDGIRSLRKIDSAMWNLTKVIDELEKD